DPRRNGRGESRPYRDGREAYQRLFRGNPRRYGNRGTWWENLLRRPERCSRAWRGDENLGCGRALYLSWFYRRTHAHRPLLPALRISSGVSPARDDGAHGVLRRIGDGFWLSWCKVFSR